jgi:hypothetical protein
MTTQITFSGAPTNPVIPLKIGQPGQSAYELWLAAGNTGTQADFLASLKGTKGDAGGQGPQGASPYELAVARGFQGNEDDWLASLKGAPGTNASYTVDDLPPQVPVTVVPDSNGTYPTRASITNDPTRVVQWRGSPPPPADAIPGIDLWLKPQTA